MRDSYTEYPRGFFDSQEYMPEDAEHNEDCDRYALDDGGFSW
jgi:hypothetical protein